MYFGFNNQFIKVKELGQYLKNFKKYIFFLFVSGITNLYVKHILDIKKVFLLTT